MNPKKHYLTKTHATMAANILKAKVSNQARELQSMGRKMIDRVTPSKKAMAQRAYSVLNRYRKPSEGTRRPDLEKIQEKSEIDPSKEKSPLKEEKSQEIKKNFLVDGLVHESSLSKEIQADLKAARRDQGTEKVTVSKDILNDIEARRRTTGAYFDGQDMFFD